jgi:tRNA threonylcarbamoyladenosine biosynthesis protein TsaB
MINENEELCVIGVDTTTSIFSMALVRGEKQLGRIVVDAPGYQTEDFLSFLEAMLKENGMKEDEVDGYAISIGPGSLTGIRVGLSFLMGIGFVTGKPVVPVKTLYAIAFPYRDSGEFICPVVETRKGKVFCALYDFGSEKKEFKQDSAGRTLIEQSCMAITELLNRVPQKEILFLGSGALTYRDLVKKIQGAEASFAEETITHPDPVSVAIIGLEKIRGGEIPSLQKIEPVYL